MHAEQTTQTRETSGGAGAPCSSLSCKARGVDAHPEREQHAIARGCHQHVTALDGLPDDPHGCRSRRTVHVWECQQPLCPAARVLRVVPLFHLCHRAGIRTFKVGARHLRKERGPAGSAAERLRGWHTCPRSFLQPSVSQSASHLEACECCASVCCMLCRLQSYRSSRNFLQVRLY